ncbi:MAG: DEAD/DEAH box helicase [Acidimicrobiales bacterium]
MTAIDTGAATAAALLDALDATGRLVHVETLPERLPTVAALARPLPGAIAHLEPVGGLWRHQVQAIDLLRDRQSVVIATPTASGKSRCYQIPIAESVVTGLRAGTSLLLYPTKALAQDQLRAFGDLEVPGLAAMAYDGDATRAERTWARDHANVVLTNPEMLHHALLPHHQKWAAFFRRLDYVVIDELHVLRGVFGSNVAHLLRRLRRVCELHGSSPTFVFCSATIGEPDTLASQLCGHPVTAVTDDASPAGTRHVALVQPATIDADKGIRQSPATEAISVLSELTMNGQRTMCFCPSRAMTERVAAGVTRALPAPLADTVRAYRSGYLASERREIEDDVASGKVRTIVTTSALELGVDIGGLDATVLCGFPGTIASLWQQIGRAGRSQQESVAVVIAGDDQLDQWFVHHPKDLFERAPEPAVINAANTIIADPHLACAAYEFPLTWRDDQWWPDLDDAVRRLVQADDLSIRPGRQRIPRAVWGGRGMPFHRVGLRSGSSGEVAIVDRDDTLIGTVELDRASTRVHPGAVYLHRGQAFRVEALDLVARRAIVSPDDGRHYTQTRTSIDIDVTAVRQSKAVGRSQLHLGNVKVTTQVTGYHLFEQGTASAIEKHDLDLPPQELLTTAVWYEWTPKVAKLAGIPERLLPGALHAAEHTAIGILPLFAICDRWDVGGVSIAAAGHSGLPTVFIYDGFAGGAGVAELAFDASDRHLAATIDVLDQCPCDAGCPSCVQSPKCGNGNELLDKHAALALLHTTIGFDEPF